MVKDKMTCFEDGILMMFSISLVSVEAFMVHIYENANSKGQAWFQSELRLTEVLLSALQKVKRGILYLFYYYCWQIPCSLSLYPQLLTVLHFSFLTPPVLSKLSRGLYVSRLRPIDVEFMKRLGKIVSIVPVIAKADTLTIEERQEFKERVMGHTYTPTTKVCFSVDPFLFL